MLAICKGYNASFDLLYREEERIFFSFTLPPFSSGYVWKPILQCHKRRAVLKVSKLKGPFESFCWNGSFFLPCSGVFLFHILQTGLSSAPER